MTRVAIRNTLSPKETKPRVFDALIGEDGELLIEVKQGKRSEVIAWREVLRQINLLCGKEK